jgi:hypothetical protein
LCLVACSLCFCPQYSNFIFQRCDHAHHTCTSIRARRAHDDATLGPYMWLTTMLITHSLCRLPSEWPRHRKPAPRAACHNRGAVRGFSRIFEDFDWAPVIFTQDVRRKTYGILLHVWIYFFNRYRSRSSQHTLNDFFIFVISELC